MPSNEAADRIATAAALKIQHGEMALLRDPVTLQCILSERQTLNAAFEYIGHHRQGRLIIWRKSSRAYRLRHIQL